MRQFMEMVAFLGWPWKLTILALLVVFTALVVGPIDD